jgi:hypothetical protein
MRDLFYSHPAHLLDSPSTAKRCQAALDTHDQQDPAPTEATSHAPLISYRPRR